MASLERCANTLARCLSATISQPSMPNWNERQKMDVLVFALKCEFAVISFRHSRSTATSMAHIGTASAVKCVVVSLLACASGCHFSYSYIFIFVSRFFAYSTDRFASRDAIHTHIELHNEVRRFRHDHMYGTGTYEFLFRFIESINNSCTECARCTFTFTTSLYSALTLAETLRDTQDTHAYKLLLSPIYSARKMYSRKRFGRFNSCLCTWLSAVISHALRVMFIKGKAYHMPSRMAANTGTRTRARRKKV